MLKFLRSINPMGKALLVISCTALVGVFGHELWFMSGLTAYDATVDIEWVILTIVVTLLGSYFLLFGVRNK